MYIIMGTPLPTGISAVGRESATGHQFLASGTVPG